jgi:hypothetical protein
MTEEKRRFTRVLFNAPVTLILSERSWESTNIDLSLNGALVQQPQGWNGTLNDACTLTLPLSENDRIEMQAIIAHAEDGRIGLQCKHIDIDSITHLRRLMELNSGNAELLDRELSLLG